MTRRMATGQHRPAATRQSNDEEAAATQQSNEEEDGDGAERVQRWTEGE